MEAGMFVCWNSGEAPERSSFSQTCSRLSQFLKEKRGFGYLNVEVAKKLESSIGNSELGISPAPVTTLDLLTNIEQRPYIKHDVFPPKNDGFVSSISAESICENDFRKLATKDPDTAQMTIIYAGKVLTFYDFPANKAKEILLLASKKSPHTFNGFYPSSKTNLSQVRPKPLANGYGLTIARRGSLHKFLERRKERVNAKAPYQVTYPFHPPKLETSNSRLELEAQTSNNLELKL